MLRLGVTAFLACLVLLAGVAAPAAKPNPAIFRVTLTATLTKNWTFTRVDSEAGCTRTTRGVGRWHATLATRRPAGVLAIAAPDGRVRFPGARLRAIDGSATQSGTMTVTSRGAPPCDGTPRPVRCSAERRSFRGGFASFGSPRRGVLRLGSLRGAAPIRSFDSTCPEEPSDVRSIRTDLTLPAGPLDRSDVFSRDVRRWFISGDSEQVTTIEGDVPGRVTERVRWTLTFTRVTR